MPPPRWWIEPIQIQGESSELRYDWAMRSLKWSTSEAVWIAEIDDEHKAIFEAVTGLQKLLSAAGPTSEIRNAFESLTSSIVGHFGHEERLMRASRYPSLRWHKQLHDAACRKVRQYAPAVEQGDRAAGLAVVEYLASWLRDHTRVADRMMASHLRNERRCVAKVTFRAGTKPADACTWVDATGKSFDPLQPTTSL